MLVLTRKHDESVIISYSKSRDMLLKVTVVQIQAGTVRLGFEAQSDILIHRSEVWDRANPTQWERGVRERYNSRPSSSNQDSRLLNNSETVKPLDMLGHSRQAISDIPMHPNQEGVPPLAEH